MLLNANIPCTTADTVCGCVCDVMVHKLTKLHHHQGVRRVSVVRPSRQLCTNPPGGRQFKPIGGTFARQTTATTGVFRQHDPVKRCTHAAKVGLPQVVAGSVVAAETAAVVTARRGQPGAFLVDCLAGQTAQVTSQTRKKYF